jgi:hypothetical protein
MMLSKPRFFSDSVESLSGLDSQNGFRSTQLARALWELQQVHQPNEAG